MNKFLRSSKTFVNRNASTILTCVGGAGVVVTSVLAVKATPKALMLLTDATKEKGEKLTPMETIKVAGPAYIPAVISGVSTIACIFGANILNKKQQAAITSAYALLSNSYSEYKDKVKELYGEEADIRVREELVKDKYESNNVETEDGKLLFYDEFSERYFNATMETVLRAEYEINKKINLWGGANVNEFYELLDIPEVDYGKYLGWSSDGLMLDSWGKWLDFEHDKTTLDDGLECIIISFSSEPLFEYEYY